VPGASFTPGAAAAKAAPKKAEDKIGAELTKFGQTAEQITATKALLKELAADKKKGGPIDRDLFMKLHSLSIFKLEADKLSHCANVHIIKRTSIDLIKSKGGQRGGGQRGGHNKGNYNNRHNDQDNVFDKGTAKPQQRTGGGWGSNEGHAWKREDMDEKNKLKEKAQQQLAKMKVDKNDH